MKASRFIGLRQYQSGAVLLVSLILLVLLTLFAIAAVNFTNTQSRIAGNLQVRNELKVVTQQAIEQVISSSAFTLIPLSPGLPCSSSPQNCFYFDINGDGPLDYKVTVTTTCISSIPIPVDQLDRTNPADQSCTITGAVANPGIAGSVASNASNCASSVWDVAATGTDDPGATFKTAAAVTSHQGVSVRVGTGTGTGC